jgi:tRNA A-37 threonylcarbamoyl transferase component Bud32
MKKIKNNILSCCYKDCVEDLLFRINTFFNKHPEALRPINGQSDTMLDLFSSNNFELYPTKRKTTVFYDKKADIFIKLIFPIKLKEKIRSKFINLSEKIYLLSNDLKKIDIKVPEVLAYGKVKNSIPFFFMKKITGCQLKTILIREKRKVPVELYFDVIKNVADLHKAGYWFRDLHLAQIFVNDSKVSGFIDIDGIRRNFFFKKRHQAKDLSGLNHPELNISSESKKELLEYYMNLLNIDNKIKFRSYVNKYSYLRWKEFFK